MARNLANFPNIDGPDSDFPSGRIKDNPGNGTGTPINEETNGDLQQAWHKLMRVAKMVYNNLPDSAYVGFQFFQALMIVMNKWITNPLFRMQNNAIASGLTIMYGIVGTLTNSDNTLTWTEGMVFFGGKTYFIAADSVTKTGGQVFVFSVVNEEDSIATIAAGSSGSGMADYTDGARAIKTKRIQIGEWRMNNDSSVSVAHGLSATEFLTIGITNISIIKDGSATIDMLGVKQAVDTVSNGVRFINSTVISLTRENGGQFDDSDWNDPGFNRGFIDIAYQEV